MKKQKQRIDEVINEFCTYLRFIRRSDATIARYSQIWRRVKTFMSLHKIKFYDKFVGDKFLISVLGNFEYVQLNNPGKDLVNRVEALYEFQCTGTVLKGMQRKPLRLFTGPIGEAMSNYIYFRECNFKLCKKTIVNYHIYLHELLVFLNAKGIHSLPKITKSDVLLFAGSINPHKLATKHVSLNIIKGFFRHLHEQRLILVDYSKIIPRVNYNKQSHLPSVFSREEVGTLLNSIDRANPKGKRDYAILLLATKLGLRTSDIAALKFENILWQKNLIEFNQVKTGKHLTLPLIPEIGNAIIDYLKYGRPVSNENHCFLQILSPYKIIAANDIHNLVNFHISRAGINVRNRKHGPHALRHSFAANLLSNKTLLPVISEALGHNNTESTMLYLRIDINTLKQCVLNVPLVPTSFYNQKGGNIS